MTAGTRKRAVKTPPNFERRTLKVERSVKPQHVSHLVPTWRFANQPVGSSQGARGKSISARRAMREFDPFPDSREIDGVFPDDVTSANGVDADLASTSFADHAFSPVTRCVVILQRSGLREDLAEALCCPAGRIL